MDVKINSPEVTPAQEKKIRQLIKVPRQVVDKESTAAKKVAGEFEALFVGLMLKSMRATTGGESLTGGKGEEMYRSLLDQEYARVVAESGSLGLAAIIEKELNRTNTERGLEQAGTGNPQKIDHRERRGE